MRICVFITRKSFGSIFCYSLTQNLLIGVNCQLTSYINTLETIICLGKYRQRLRPMTEGICHVHVTYTICSHCMKINTNTLVTLLNLYVYGSHGFYRFKGLYNSITIINKRIKKRYFMNLWNFTDIIYRRLE